MSYERMRNELRDYYLSEADPASRRFCEECLPVMDELYAPGMSVFAMKRLQYGVITERMKPVVFSSCPFYYETGALAAQCDGARDFRGHVSAAGWVYWKNKDLFKTQDPALYQLVKEQKKEKLYNICGYYNDASQHFVFNALPVLKGGLKSVYERALGLIDGANDGEKDFLQSVCEGLLCLKLIGEKFAEEAKKKLENCDPADAEQRKNLLRIADSAARCPWEAPESFFEGLNALAFLRKAIGSLEGIGFSSFGRPDYDLEELYENDLKNGVITKEEAFELIGRFLVAFDCHYDHDVQFAGYSDHELENTFVLGGCDENGEPFCNELTLMFLRAAREEKTIYPKIKLRYDARSPKVMLDEADKAVINSLSVVLFQNDAANIPALIKLGRTPEEARDYLVYGCWGIGCRGVEKQDDGAYVNAIKPLELAVHRDFETMERVGMRFEPLDGAKSFEEVYRIALGHMRILLSERARITAAGGRIWDRIDVLPIFSSTLKNCLETKRDYTQRGAKYRDDRYLFFAFPNLVDSLLAIKNLCFDKKKYALDDYLAMVRNGWTDAEIARLDAVHSPGWGMGNDTADAFALRLQRDLGEILSGLEGVYGGKVTMGFLGYTEVKWWGEATRATPDGRHDGDYLSQGLTPSRLKKITSATSLIKSLRSLDVDLMGGNSVINVILPPKKTTLDVCEAFLRAASGSAMQSLQLNCASLEDLLDAQKHPEKYPDLIVRVTGFSAKFTSLSPDWQREFITRNFYE
ncbi:MAG: hypothetical protein IJV00_02060 [Clostridia bacterium]|nr:hypothetical protein [Clostridia bacterium]